MPEDATLEIDFTDRLVVWPERHDVWMNFRCATPTPRGSTRSSRTTPAASGSIPVVARLDGQEWTTALFRYQDGSWSLPVKTPHGWGGQRRRARSGFRGSCLTGLPGDDAAVVEEAAGWTAVGEGGELDGDGCALSRGP